MNIYSIYEETYILLITILGGILIAFMYDLYRVLRGIITPKKIATMAQDLIFWCFIFVVAFYVLIFSNEGEVRYYNFLGFVIGSIFYQVSLSRAVVKSVMFLFRNIKNFILDTYKLVRYPLDVTICLITGPYNYCKKKSKPIYYKIRKISRLPKDIIKATKKTIKTYFKKK